MNVLNAIGRVGRDAEVKFLPDGSPVATFSFALTSGYGAKQVTTWLNCTIFGKRAETLAPMLLKGTQIGITGEFCLRPYQGKDGTEKTSADLRVSDVTLLGKSSDTGSVHETRTEQKPERKAAAPDFEDDIPFANPYRGRACYVV